MTQPEDQYQPGFDIALNLHGLPAERFVRDLLGGAAAGTVKIEVKNDRVAPQTGNLYIEYECCGRDGTWRPSGIATTEAHYWAFTVGGPKTVLIVEIDTLKSLGRQAHKAGERAECKWGDNPTRGVVLNVRTLMKNAGRFPEANNP